ncbi:hypothetical protein OAK04_01480 [Verrucomicrobia bacterium]|nr:hypothetical protein [Verrucomicrobiota bacterium]
MCKTFFVIPESKIATAPVIIEYTNNPEKSHIIPRGILPRVCHPIGVKALQIASHGFISGSTMVMAASSNKTMARLENKKTNPVTRIHFFIKRHDIYTL